MTNRTTLRRGWTTGACATAAAKSAFAALLTGAFTDPVTIILPGGSSTAFALADHHCGSSSATAAIIKDAGDDPDVTHGALIRVTVSHGETGTGIRFRAGPGVGTVTRPGLPISPGEPAINPIPRAMIRAALTEIAGLFHAALDVVVEISVPGGEIIAERTLNGRLGIVGGLSILGTTGIVIPFSCAAWIDSIHRGIDVARATGLGHVAGATGRTSELAVQALYGLDEVALVEMGDFAGGMMKYLRRHPVARVTVAGGVAKMTKLAQGRLDLHSSRHAVDLPALAELAIESGGTAALAASILAANTVAEAFGHAAGEGIALGDAVAESGWRTAAEVMAGADIALDVVLFDRSGVLVGRSQIRPVHAPPPGRNRRR